MTSIFVLIFYFQYLHFYWYHFLLKKFRFIHRLMINILQSKPRGTGVAWWQLLASSIPCVHLWMLFRNKRWLSAQSAPRGKAAINDLLFPNNIQRCTLGMLEASNCHHETPVPRGLLWSMFIMRRWINRNFLRRTWHQ